MTLASRRRKWGIVRDFKRDLGGRYTLNFLTGAKHLGANGCGARTDGAKEARRSK